MQATLPAPLVSNELLIRPEEKFWDLQWDSWKYYIFARVICVAFAALAIAALWWACFFAPEATPFVVLGSAYFFQVVHAAFIQPLEQESRMYSSRLQFEERVATEITRITHERVDLAQAFQTLGANPPSDMVQHLAPILARYNVHTAMATEINNRCNARDNVRDGLLQRCSEPNLDLQTWESRILETTTFHAETNNLRKPFAMHRFSALFCLYVANNPTHHGSLARLGGFLNYDITSDALMSAEFFQRTLNGVGIPLFRFHDGRLIGLHSLNSPWIFASP